MTIPSFLRIAALLGCLNTSLVVAADSELETTLFASADKTPCPAVIAAAPTGEVFVGVDLQGSLGKKVGLGKIVRLVDKDNDGSAELASDFAKIDNPRGIIAIGDQLIVLHCTAKDGKVDTQQLSVFTDADWDGIADGPAKPLVKNLGNPKFLKDRGTDHSTNNIRLGIDGWIYIAVGDFGFLNAEGTDGQKLTMYGGVARVRPDGSGLETYITGTRNVYDIAIDPFMNVFTRENTNDGVGWWARASHYIQSADYGYPSLYTNFPEDMLPALAEYGRGSGVGCLYLQEPQWPEKYNDQPLLSDWGHSMVYMHEMEPYGATFQTKASEFISSSQVTDLDVDGSGRMYVAAWNGAGYEGNTSKGYVERVIPKDWEYKAFPDLKSLNKKALFELLSSKSITARTYVSQEFIRRKEGAEELYQYAKSTEPSRESRVAALYTMGQLLGLDAHKPLQILAADSQLREHAIRAMADNLDVAKKADITMIHSALNDNDPRVQVAAIVALGRIGDLKSAQALLPFALPAEYKKTPDSKARLKNDKVKPVVRDGYISPSLVNPHSKPVKELVIAHVAQKALVSMNAEEAIISGINSSDKKLFLAALTTAKFMHSEKVVMALIEKASSASSPAKGKIADVLMRLHQKEKENDGTTWWSTRPDPSGPYITPIDWEGTSTITSFLKSYIDSVDDKDVLIAQLKRNKAFVEPYNKRLAVKKASKAKKVGKTSIEDVVIFLGKYKGNAKRGAKVITQVGCAGCHNIDLKESVKGPDLTKLGGMSNADLAEAILKPGATIAASWVTITMQDGIPHLGTIVKEDKQQITLHNIAGMPTILNVNEVVKREPGLNMMSLHLCDDLTLNAFGDLIKYIKRLDSKKGK